MMALSDKAASGPFRNTNSGSEKTLQCILQRLVEPMNFPLGVSPSKEMGDRTRQRKQSSISTGIEESVGIARARAGRTCVSALLKL